MSSGEKKGNKKVFLKKAFKLSSEHRLFIIVFILVINLLLLWLDITRSILILTTIDTLVHVLIVIIAVFAIFSQVLAYLLNFIRSRI
jgi:hypothetical protein